MTGSPSYRLDELGWLQFGRLCSLVLEAEAGLSDLYWHGRGDIGRVAIVDGGLSRCARRRDSARGSRRRRGHLGSGELVDGGAAGRVPGSRCGVARRSEAGRMAGADEPGGSRGGGGSARVSRQQLARGRAGSRGDLGKPRSPSAAAGCDAVRPGTAGSRRLDRTRRPRPVPLDAERAQELARVFWPTRAYARAREVLGRHRFVVLTGPPEMGKTAIAEMLALAHLTDGWEAHQCNDPEQVWRVFDRDRRQMFVADDAFGSTEYRPDAAERWARGPRAVAGDARRAALADLDLAPRAIESGPAPGSARERFGAIPVPRRGAGRRLSPRSGRQDADPVPPRQELRRWRQRPQARALRRIVDRRAPALHPRADPPVRDRPAQGPAASRHRRRGPVAGG